jgi:hypothetical protein
VKCKYLLNTVRLILEDVQLTAEEDMNTCAVIRDVTKRFGEWYQKTNKTEDTNKLTLLAFKIITILHNTLLVTFIKLLKTVSKGLIRNRWQNCCHSLWIAPTFAKRAPFMMLFRRGNRKKFSHRTHLILRPQATDQGRRVGG